MATMYAFDGVSHPIKGVTQKVYGGLEAVACDLSSPSLSLTIILPSQDPCRAEPAESSSL